MGKSEKKVKPVRLNALRKQYDAFLEEDKKRRERNEDILGRLDKMRMSTAILLRNGVSQLAIDSRCRDYDRHLNDDIPQTSTQSLVPVRPPVLSYTSPRLDDEILKEIKKKYILIPKQTHSFATEELFRHETPAVTDSSDWKSKYDILTQLKQNEKESSELISTTRSNSNVNSSLIPEPEKFNFADIPERDLNTEAKDRNKVNFNENMNHKVMQNDGNTINDNNLETSNSDNSTLVDYKNVAGTEIVRQSVYADLGINNMSDSHDNKVNCGDDYQTDVSENVIYANVTKKNILDHADADDAKDLNLNFADYDVNEELLTNTIEASNMENNEYDETSQNVGHVGYATEYAAMDHQNSPQYAPEAVSNEVPPNTYINENTNYAQGKELSAEVTNSPLELSMVIDQNPIIHAQGTSGIVDLSEYPIDVIQSEEFTPEQGVAVIDGVNINPPGYEDGHVVVDESHDPNMLYPIENNPVSEEITSSVDVSQINEFDEENKQMFYSEDQNVAHEYNTQEEYVPNTEQPAQNGTYDEHGQYVYYEGTAQIQEYPVEYTENEATMQPYDQTYEQQYGNTTYEQQQYEQGQYDEQYQQQGVEQPHIYENVEEYSEPPNASINDIQQQLDNEQGYTEQVLNSEDANIAPADVNENLAVANENLAQTNENLAEANENHAEANVNPVDANEKIENAQHKPIQNG